MSSPDDVVGENAREIFVLDFVKDRADDIACLLVTIDNAGMPRKEVTHGPRTCLQHMPRHMRRRAMSHNVKRFPITQRRFAEASASQTKHRAKPPSRHWRRRPANLLQAYLQRARRHRWLETHIWHAKRFHMIDRWGYRLPTRSCARSHRAAYRDVRSHAIVQDISFHTALQITSTDNSDHGRQTLVEQLNRLVNSCNGGLTFRYAAAFNGSTECNVIVHDPTSGLCIGPITYHWIDTASIWIWSHPSITSTLISTIVKLFELEKRQESAPEATPAASLSSAQHSQLESGRCRQSSAIIKRVCQPASIVRWSLESQVTSSNSCLSSDQSASGSTCLQPDVSIRHSTIVPLVVSDPRVTRPVKKKPPSSRLKPSDSAGSPTDYYSCPLYSPSIRSYVLTNKVPDHVMHQAKTEGPSALAKLDIGLPVVLIRRCRSLSGLDDGWDMIVPAGYVKAFWLCLQYNTARATAIRDHQHLMLERHVPGFPDLWPDTEAGRTAVKEKADQLRVKWQRRPPNRKKNYNHLKIRYPFAFDWTVLTSDWADSGAVPSTDTKVVVLRNSTTLRWLDTWLRQLGTARTSPLTLVNEDNRQMIVPVIVTPVRHGTSSYLSVLCIPETDDNLLGGKPAFTEALVPYMSNQTHAINTVGRSADVPFESIISLLGDHAIDMDDLFPDADRQRERERSEGRTATRRRHRASATVRKNIRKQATSEEPVKKSTRDHPSRPDGMKSAVDASNDDDVTRGVRYSCSRQVIGAVMQAEYTFSAGRPTGLGFVSLSALSNLKHNRILFRSVNSRHYHSAVIHIATEIYE